MSDVQLAVDSYIAFLKKTKATNKLPSRTLPYEIRPAYIVPRVASKLTPTNA